MSNSLSIREFVQRLLLAILIVALALALWELRSTLLLIFLAVIIAAGLSRPAAALQNRGVARPLAVMITLVGTLFILGVLSIIIVPLFVEQVSSLIEQLPQAIERAQQDYNRLASGAFLPSLQISQAVSDSDIREFIVSQAGSASRSIFPFLSDIGGVLTNLLVVMVLAIFLLAEPGIYVEGLLTLFPRSYRPRALQIFDALGDAIGQSLGAQIVAMFIVGTLTTAGLMFIGVPNALALGMIAGLLNFIPTFGPIVALFIGIIFTVASVPDKFLPVLILYLFIQQLESNIITPRIVKRTLNMPGAVVIMTQLVASILFGFLGLVLAVPLVAVVMVLVRELYVYDVLNSRKAEVQIVQGRGGHDLVLVSNKPYRPEELSPGEAARLTAEGNDPFEVVEQSHTIEIIGPTDQIQKVSQNQQAVWLAIMALIVAQTIAFIRSLVITEHKPSG